MQRVIVGMDGSDGAQNALRWALDHTEPDDEVVAVHVWQMPIAAGVEAPLLDPAPFASGAEASLGEDLASVSADHDIARVTQRVVQGHAGEALLHEATGADLLVVGARGRGGFVGLLIGSVTTYVVNHARVPTVVIPHNGD